MGGTRLIYGIAAGLFLLPVIAGLGAVLLGQSVTPAICDLASLGLVIDKAVVLSPAQAFGKNAHMISLKEDEQLVVVGVKGRTPGPCRIVLTPNVFSIQYVRPGEASAPKCEAPAKAAKWMGPFGLESMWVFRLSETAWDTERISLDMSWPVAFKAAWVLPRGVSRLSVFAGKQAGGMMKIGDTVIESASETSPESKTTKTVQGKSPAQKKSNKQ